VLCSLSPPMAGGTCFRKFPLVLGALPLTTHGSHATRTHKALSSSPSSFVLPFTVSGTLLQRCMLRPAWGRLSALKLQAEQSILLASI